MKYVASPVVVDAFKIMQVHRGESTIRIMLEDGVEKELEPEMYARHNPQVGDYLVRSEDGYEYLNPANVFERKYFPEPCAYVAKVGAPFDNEIWAQPGSIIPCS